ncbi:MAG: hypothetical protein HYZ28_04170 [Myxococcales bacterium]|nr:hypothetical protein [Myxococcales bacterium]
MAIRSAEGTSTAELRRDARYHVAALLSDSSTESLAADIKRKGAGPKERSAAADGGGGFPGGGAEPRGTAVSGRLPKGAGGAGGAPRGRGGAGGALSKRLDRHFPAIAKRHRKELARLATRVRDAEGAWLRAETEAQEAFGEEMVARAELERQLRRNEGLLMAQFPGERGKVRTFFRPHGGAKARPKAAAGAASPQETKAGER